MSEIPLDNEGYLTQFSLWSPEMAENLHGQSLSDAQWPIVWHARAFYEQYQLSPSMKLFLAYLLEKDPQNPPLNVLSLKKLFPGAGSPMIRIARAAGLPKPINCIQ